MRIKRSTRYARPFAWAVFITAIATVSSPTTISSHENHAPLPTVGVTIAGDNVLLSDGARSAIGLTTQGIAFADLRHTVEVNAQVELPWNQQAMITSLLPGRIESVLARPGEIVEPGQELAQVASMEMETLQLSMLQAASERDLAQRLVDQRRNLGAGGVIAGKSLLEAEADLDRKKAELRIAIEKLRALGIEDDVLESMRATGRPLPFTSITSPIGGVITHADVRIGQVVETNDHLYHVADPSRVWVVGEVLESDVRHLEEGQSATVRFAAYPDVSFDGVIDHVRLKMERRTRTQSVVIALDNPEGLLRPGMFGRVEIAVRVAEQAIVCPNDAVINTRTGSYVLVERSPGKYENRSVSLGLVSDSQVEVFEGLFPGDKVVVTGSYLLASLLGNEHKARTSDDEPDEDDATDVDPERLIAAADATVELPTDRQSFAGPKIEGRIRQVLVEPSQWVEAGQVLAEVDSLELRTVQLNLLQTVSLSYLTEQSLTRLRQLGAQSISPERRIWELENQRDTLLHEGDSLKRRLSFFGLTDEEIDQLSRIDLTESDMDAAILSAVPIRAPSAGWIVDFQVVPGQIVRPEDQLFEIHDLSKVWVKGYVFERDMSRIAIGKTARVTFSAFPDMEAMGTVVRIAPMMEESERVLPIWIEVDNADRLLKEGMFARVAVFDEVTDAYAAIEIIETPHMIP